MSLIAELQRRNVFRVSAAYLALGWIVTQVTQAVVPALNLPETIPSIVIWIGIAAFPFVVVFAWVYELTPEGIKRESEIDRSSSITGQTAGKLDRIVIALLLIAILVGLADRFLPGRAVTPEPAAATTGKDASPAPAPAAPADSNTIDSIAVLPFEDFSPDGGHAYLGTGIADTVLHALSQIPGLKVAARTSSFQMHDQKADIATIGRTLGVGAVLEGSVQAAGKRLRIIAQLVRTSDQSHYWSKTFEGDVEDIFATQDTIAAAVASSLRGEAAPVLAKQQSTTPEVFELVAQGRHLWQQRNPADSAAALEALEQAVGLDPGYAPAYSELAAARWFSYLYAGADPAKSREGALAAAERALAIDPSMAQPWSVRGLVASDEANLVDAISAYQKAIELDPNNSNAMAWLSFALDSAGLHNEARTLIERAYRLDPVSSFIRGAYARALRADPNATSRRLALDVVEESLRLAPGSYRVLSDAGTVITTLGDPVTAVKYVLQAIRLRPNSTDARYQMVFAMYYAGDPAAAAKWGASIDVLPSNTPAGSWAWATGDWERFLASSKAYLDQQPDNRYAIANYAFALTLASKDAEAIDWSERALVALRAGRYRDVVDSQEISAACQLLALQQRAGNQARVEELRRDIVPAFAALQRNGIGQDIFSAMLTVDYHLATGDPDAALDALRMAGGTNDKYLALVWRQLPLWSAFGERADVKAILDGWEAERVKLGERMRAEAPPEAFDPSLIPAAPQ